MDRKRLIAAAVAVVAVVIAIIVWQGRGSNTRSAQTPQAQKYLRMPSRIAGPPTSSVSGTVRDPTGAPIAHASVCAQTKDLDVQCAITDEHGTYSIGQLFALAYEVTAAAPKFRPGRYHPDGDPRRDRFVLTAGERRTGVDVVLMGPAVELVGTVSDISGGPIAHARVRVAREGWNINEWRHWYPATETAADGSFTLWVAEGEHWLESSAEGYGSVEQEVIAPGRLDVMLTPGGSIAGTVVDRDNRPIEGALVMADWIDEHEVARSDDAGHFVIEGLVPARYDVSARTPNGYGTAVGSVRVPLAGRVDGIIIRVDPAAHIVGRVVTKPPATLCPPADVHVKLHDPFGDDVEMSVAADGTLHADGIVASTYYAQVSCRGYYTPERYPPIVVADRDLELSWPVAPGATLRGHVRAPDGTPLARVHVALYEGPGYFSADPTTSDGSYEVSGIAPGTYDARVSAGYNAVVTERLTVGTAPIEKDFVLERSAKIRGLVVDANNHPVPGVEVRAEAKRSDVALRTSRPDGTFELEVKAGTYNVYAAVDWQRPIGKPERVTVTLTQPASVRLVVPAQTGTIRGDVSDMHGAPVGDAFVHAYTPSMFGDAFQIGWNEHPTLTNPDGTFTISGLGPGAYTVIAQKRGGGTARVHGVDVGSKVSLVIPKLGSIAGHVSYTDQTHPQQMTLTVRNEEGAAERFFREQRFYHTGGAFTIDEVPAGTLTIAVTTPDDSLGVASLLLSPGEQRTDVEITVERSVILRGRLVDQYTREGATGYFILPRPTRAKLGAYIDWMDVTHQTDVNGAFSVRSPPGGINLEISKGTLTPRDRSYCAPPKNLDVRGAMDLGDLPLVRPRAQNAGELGFTLGNGTVDSLDPNGPAAAAGLRMGDVVTAIDGVGPASLVADCGFAMIAVAPGSVLSLTLLRGDTIRVTAGAEPPEIEIDDAP